MADLYAPVVFTAACPACGNDATWTGKAVDGPIEGQWHYMSKIISIECGVCE